MISIVALYFILVHAPGGIAIEVNPSAILSLRVPRSGDATLVHKGAKCLLFMSDGKFISVIESCAEVHDMIAALRKPRQGP